MQSEKPSLSVEEFGGLRLCPRLQPRQFSLILPSSNGCKPVNYGNYCLPAGLDSTGRQSHQDHPRPPLFICLSQSSCAGAGVKQREFHKHDAGPCLGFAVSRPSRHATIRWHQPPLLFSARFLPFHRPAWQHSAQVEHQRATQTESADQSGLCFHSAVTPLGLGGSHARS